MLHECPSQKKNTQRVMIWNAKQTTIDIKLNTPTIYALGPPPCAFKHASSTSNYKLWFSTSFIQITNFSCCIFIEKSSFQLWS
jgi:hypothetical protein